MNLKVFILAFFPLIVISFIFPLMRVEYCILDFAKNEPPANRTVVELFMLGYGLPSFSVGLAMLQWLFVFAVALALGAAFRRNSFSAAGAIATMFITSIICSLVIPKIRVNPVPWHLRERYPFLVLKLGHLGISHENSLSSEKIWTDGHWIDRPASHLQIYTARHFWINGDSFLAISLYLCVVFSVSGVAAICGVEAQVRPKES